MSDAGRTARADRWIRLAGRLIASIAALLWLFVIIAQVVIGLQKGQDVFTLEGSLLGILILVNAVGTVLAWWKPVIGANAILAGGLALSVFALISAGRNHAVAVLVSGAPFLLAGILILTASRTLTKDTGS